MFSFKYTGYCHIIDQSSVFVLLLRNLSIEKVINVLLMNVYTQLLFPASGRTQNPMEPGSISI